MRADSQVDTLLDVPNPTSLVSLKWTDRRETSLSAIKGFKNLVDLDLTGNCLSSPVPELLHLKYLRKLTLARNEMHRMWELPEQLEYLSLAENHIELWQGRMAGLKSLDLSYNDFRGVSSLPCLSHLTSLYLSHNRLTSLAPLTSFPQLLELDLSFNLLSTSSLSEVLQHPSLSAVGVRGNPGAEDIQPTADWSIVLTKLLYRDIDRLKLLPNSRLRKEIKENLTSKHVSYYLPEEIVGEESSEFTLEEENPNSEFRSKEKYAAERNRAEELWEEVIADCGLLVPSDTPARYEAAKDELLLREKERCELQAKCRQYESILATVTEQFGCKCADLESIILNMHCHYETNFDSLRRELADLSDLKEIKSPDEEISLVYDFQSMREQSRVLGHLTKGEIMSLSDSKRLDEDHYEKPFSKQLESGKVRVPRFVGEFVERLKRSNSRLRDRLMKAKSQRDKCAFALRQLQGPHS